MRYSGWVGILVGICGGLMRCRMCRYMGGGLIRCRLCRYMCRMCRYMGEIN